MATDFNISPYFDDYLAEDGGLDKNYYKVLFRPGRALQARELTTAQTILQNQIGSFGKNFFEDGTPVYGSDRFLHNPLDYVKLSPTLSDGVTALQKDSSLSQFASFKVGDVLKDSTYNIKAVVKAVSPSEAGDPDTIWVKYLNSNSSVKVWGTSSIITLVDSATEVAYTVSSNATGVGHGISISSSIIFSNGSFIQTPDDFIIISKYSSSYNSRVGYVVKDEVITSSDDSSLYDNAQGYPNYSAPGADRNKISLYLCSLGSDPDWVQKDVATWAAGKLYHKNKKVSYTNLSGVTDVYVCINSHISTTAASGDGASPENSPNGNWVSVKSFIETLRVDNGILTSKKPRIGFSQETVDAVLSMIKERDYSVLGNYSLTMHPISIIENDKSNIKLADGTYSAANNDQMLVSVESGKSFVGGQEVIIQVPERFIVDKARTPEHVVNTANYSPSVNYGNYILVDNLTGYFDTNSNETVTFYNERKEISGYDNANNAVAIANIRYFEVNSGHKTANNSNGLEFPKYRAYIYNITGIKAGEFRSMKGALGSADTDITTKSLSTVLPDGSISLYTANVYASIYDTRDNTSLFPLAPGFIRSVESINTGETEVYYTTKTFDAKFIKENVGGTDVFRLYANTGSLFTETSIGSKLGQGLVDPANQTDVAEAYYTLYNLSGSSINVNGTDVANGEIIPETMICGESHSDFKWTSGATPTLSLYFPSTGVATSISNIRISIKVGIRSAVPDKKYFRPSRVAYVSNTATSLTQGYDSKTVSLLQGDIHKIKAIYMSSSSSEATLPSTKLNIVEGTSFLRGERLIEVTSANTTTGVDGTIIAPLAAANTYSFVVGAGADTQTYFTANNYVIGATSGTKALIKERTLNDGVRDITNRYVFLTGQTETMYDWAKIILRPNTPAPSNPIVVVYDRFDTVLNDPTEKKLYTVSSYGYFADNDFHGYSANTDVSVLYDEIGTFTTKKGILSLRDCIDFRPVRKSATSITELSGYSFSNINSYYNLFDTGVSITNPSPLVEDLFNIDYSYFNERRDLVVIDKTTATRVISGTPGKGYPVEPEGSMTLYKLIIPPYTEKITSVYKEYIDNKIFTMKDISVLENRVKALESFAKVTDDELAALTRSELSISAIYKGLERFKNGILLDSFTDFSKADTKNDEFSCSIDTTNQTLRAPFDSVSIDVDQLGTIIGTKYHPANSKSFVNSKGNSIDRVSGLVTLDYTEDVFMDQNEFTQFLSVNHYNVATYYGTMKIDPASDTWIETTIAPDLIIQNPDNVNALALEQTVNERLVINISSATGLFVVGNSVSTSSGGTAIISEISSDLSIITVIHHQGTFASGTDPATSQPYKLYSTNNVGSSIQANIVTVETKGGAAGYGSSFGDWVTSWVGSGNGPSISQRLVSNLGYVGYGTSTWNPYGGNSSSGVLAQQWEVTRSATTKQSRVASRNDLVLKTVLTNAGQKVIDVATIPYMRSVEVIFDVKGMRPNTKVVPYFDDINVSSYCAQRSGITATWQFNAIGTDLVSDKRGNVQGKFVIPKGVFKTGDRKFRLIDETEPVNSLIDATTFAEKIFTSTGTLETKQTSIISTKVPEIVQRSFTSERVTSTTTTDTKFYYYDPIAQSFAVDPSAYEEGVYITAIDVFVAGKPGTTALPLWIDVRSMENGYPSQVVAPGSRVLYNLDDDLDLSSSTYSGGVARLKTIEDHQLIKNQKISLINDSGYEEVYTITNVVDTKTFDIIIDQDVWNTLKTTNLVFSKINVATAANGWAPTRFVFEHPVYLTNSEYAFTVQSNDNSYQVYVAKLGDVSLRTNKFISSQPNLGSMFMSQNASTWSATQEFDMAFTIWKAKFETGAQTIEFSQNDDTLADLPGSGWEMSDTSEIKYSLINFQPNVLNTKSTSIQWFIKTLNDDDTYTDWVEIEPSINNVSTKLKKVKLNTESVKVKAIMRTYNDSVSPIIDLTDQRVILVENLINNSTQNEHLSFGGSSQAKYVSKSVILEEGMDAEDIKISLNGSRVSVDNTPSSITAFARVQSGVDEEYTFAERFWYPMLLEKDPGYSTSDTDYLSYNYKFPKNIWFVDEGKDTVSIFYTGDNNPAFATNPIEYNEDEISQFITIGSVILEHASYDETAEQLTYSYYDGTYGNNYAYATYDTFKRYAVKFVFTSVNKASIPVVKNYTATALT